MNISVQKMPNVDANLMGYSFVKKTNHHKVSIEMKDEVTAQADLKVLGNRCIKCLQSNYYGPGRLVVLDSLTLKPVEAVWTYAGETSGLTGPVFMDTEAQKELVIAAEGFTTVTLRPSNVVAADLYSVQGGMTLSATLVVTNDRSISGWGAGYASLPVPEEQNHEIAMVCAGYLAAAALRTDHSVFAWGNPKYGGELKIPDAARTDVKDVQMTQGMGLLQGIAAPTISQWGGSSAGSNQVPSEISNRKDIKKVLSAAGEAQVALIQSGQLLEWGSDDTFKLPIEITNLTDVQDFCLSIAAGVALRTTGELAAWGHPQRGGVLPDDIAALTDVDRIISGTNGFVALRKNGAVVCWGQGIALPASMGLLSDIVQVVAGQYDGNYDAWAMFDNNGQVYCWYGPGIEVSVPAGLSNAVALTSNWENSFAALKSDGSVVAWGAGFSADTSPVDEILTNVQAIYPITQGYLALKSDGSMVAWGNPDVQSDNASIPTELQGMVTYQY